MEVQGRQEGRFSSSVSGAAVLQDKYGAMKTRSRGILVDGWIDGLIIYLFDCLIDLLIELDDRLIE